MGKPWVRFTMSFGNRCSVRSRRGAFTLLTLCLVWIGSAVPAFCEEPPSGVWKGFVDLSLITASGNASTRTGSAKIEAARRTALDRWIARAGGLFAKNDGERTVEYYYANGEYNYFINDRTYWKYFLGWERDKLAGLDTRITGFVGMGHEFFKTPKNFLVGEAGISYVYEKREDETDNFPQGRLFGRYEHYFTEAAAFFQELEYLQDLTALTNYRINSVTGLWVDINPRWAFKTALTIHYDHQPAQGFEDTDTITETSLVFKF